jgi:ribosomal protein L20
MGLHRRRVWEIAKGFRGRARNCIKIARQQAEKALQHAYKGRKDKKKETRSLWIQRVNAASREHGVSSSEMLRVPCLVLLAVRAAAAAQSVGRGSVFAQCWYGSWELQHTFCS